MIQLKAPHPELETTSILPNPQMSDVENHQTELSIKRSMNNTKRTYIKRSPRRLLTYEFILTRQKALELRAFIELYYYSRIVLINHKDEEWVVSLVNNPFEFNATFREYMTITLNFEGIQNAP